MKKARYTSVLFILILLSALMHLPQGQAIVPDSQTISIIDTHDDRFITEAGIGIDAWLCHILDPTMDIRSYLVFRDVEVNYWEPLKNATLRLRTTVNLDFEADSSVTVYGMKYSDLQDEGVITPSFVLSVPYTSASVSLNTSQFYGQQWHEVNVTNIVEELIRSYDWDGDGNIGETGDSIGFVIVGAEGYDTRWFIDYHYGTPALASQLVIHWNHEPPPPAEYERAEFVAEYGGYTIWFINSSGYSLEPMEYIHTRIPGTWDVSYDTIHSAPGTPVQVGFTDEEEGTLYGTQRKIIRTSDGTIYAIWHKKLATFYQMYIAKSQDSGETWIGETRISTYAGMSGEHQKYGSIAVDSSNNLYVTWQGQATGFETQDQIWCNIYNVTTSSWEGPVRISTSEGMDIRPQYQSAIAVDSDDEIHLVWNGYTDELVDHIFYVNYTTSWANPLWISNATGMNTNSIPSIAIDSNNTIYVTFSGETDVETVPQIFCTNYTTSWGIPLRISLTGGMHGYAQYAGSVAVDSEDNVHVTWNGIISASLQKIWYTNYTTSWSSPVLMSTEEGMEDYHQEYPSMAIDSNDAIYVVWGGRRLAGESVVIWLSKYEGAGWTLEAIYPYTVGETDRNPNTRWARWPAIQDEEYIVVDENGTVVQDDLDSQDDAQDWIDQFDPDPEDPDPGGVWSTGPGGDTGAFTRFRMRLWFLLIGFGCLFGPILFFAWRRPSGYYILCGAIVMLIGIGMLLSIGQV